jgi:ligand-binding SRPBCC domain-containing protein
VPYFSSPTYRLEQEQLIARPLSEVFIFFSDTFNLEVLTPPFLNFKILTPAPIEVCPDTLIDYRFSLYGLAFKWRTRILSHIPQVGFVDLQERGPYAFWHHTHTFEEVDGGAVVRDVDRYRLPLGLLGRLAHVVFVGRCLRQNFYFRRDAVDAAFQTP